MRYAAGAGYAPDGLIRALKKLREHGVKMDGKNSLGGSETHPPMGDRIQLLEQILAGARPGAAAAAETRPASEVASPEANGIWK